MNTATPRLASSALALASLFLGGIFSVTGRAAEPVGVSNPIHKYDDPPERDRLAKLKADVEAAFAKAAHVTKMDIVNNRLIPNAMEPRAAAAEYDKGTGNYTLWSTSQNPHVLRLILSAFVLGIPEHKLRVVAPDVGGGFGSKIFCYNEETMVCWASSRVGRPIKWTAERAESFMTDAHGRDHVTHAELALDKDHKFLALKVETIANMGAYLSTFSTAVPTYLYATLLAGQYTTPLIYANVKAAVTHTAPVDAYRGAGRPEATFVIESIVSRAAHMSRSFVASSGKSSVSVRMIA